MQPSANLTNQTFSPARFGRLLARHAAERGAGYLLSAAVLGGIMLLVMSYASYLQGGTLSPGIQTVFYILFLLGAGSFFSSGVFTEYGHKTQGMAALTLPASQFEKFLLAWLWSLPFFLAAFIGVFYAVDATVLAVAARPDRPAELLPLATLFDFKKAGSMLFFYAVLHGLWLWGSIFFAKGQFVKMGFLLIVLGGLTTVLNFRVLKSMLGSGELELMPAVPFSDLMLKQSEQFFKLELPASQAAWLSALPLVLAALLWAAAYLRLTEKQL